MPNIVPSGLGDHPKNIFFLTADAFGVMPPLARLTPEQAIYYFLSGYTAKLAGTEKGLGQEPQVTFSTCFGAPFMPLNPKVYAKLLEERIRRYKPNVWLINTGWTGGPYGVGERIKLPFTRAMIRAALNGSLEGIPAARDPFFGLLIPETCPGVPPAVLDPCSTWKDPAKYTEQARSLVKRFEENYTQYTVG
jgi:phosphoenolpyruvate carboxykinase (ATP)